MISGGKMQEILFRTAGQKSEYSVVIANSIDGLMPALCRFLRGRKSLILTDSTVSVLHLQSFEALLRSNSFQAERLILKDGEKSKSLDAVEIVLSALVDNSFTRGDYIINFGGGVVSDLGGFAASVYMRGMNYINVPTTLLGMVDSAMGGKTGIDFAGIKNCVGSFYAPRLVVAALDYLNTLSKADIRSGFGEIAKYAMIGGEGIISDFRLSGSVDEKLIANCCRIKSKYVSSDEHDNGARRILNLGHTFGHAFEAASNFTLCHGEAVAYGLIASSRFGQRLGIVTPESVCKTESLVRELVIGQARVSIKGAARYIVHDKKSSGDAIEMVFVNEFGKPFLKSIPLSRAVSFLESYDPDLISN